MRAERIYENCIDQLHTQCLFEDRCPDLHLGPGRQLLGLEAFSTHNAGSHNPGSRRGVATIRTRGGTSLTRPGVSKSKSRAVLLLEPICIIVCYVRLPFLT